MEQNINWIFLGLGFIHGINPGMGWLLASCIAYKKQSIAALFLSLFALAFGYIASVSLFLYTALRFDLLIPTYWFRWAVVFLLFGFGLYHLLKQAHRSWIGMEAGYFNVAFWSFVISAAHGAGNMLVPYIADQHLDFREVLSLVYMHACGYILAACAASFITYAIVFRAFIKRGLVNFDLMWALSLMFTGSLLLFTRIK